VIGEAVPYGVGWNCVEHMCSGTAAIAVGFSPITTAHSMSCCTSVSSASSAPKRAECVLRSPTRTRAQGVVVLLFGHIAYIFESRTNLHYVIFDWLMLAKFHFLFASIFLASFSPPYVAATTVLSTTSLLTTAQVLCRLPLYAKYFQFYSKGKC